MADARQQLLGGQCALAICWLARSATATPDDDSQVAIQFAELPGSREYFSFAEDEWKKRSSDVLSVPLIGYAGRLGSVCRASRRQRAAWSLLSQLSGQELGTTISSASQQTAPYRQSQLASPAAWAESQLGPSATREYAQVVAAALSHQTLLAYLRIPGHAEYLQVLDEAVRAAVLGEQTPEAALQLVANAWQQITEKYGLAAQRIAYAMNIGIEP